MVSLFSKTIAHAAYGFDPIEVGPKFFAQRGDMHVDVAVDDKGVVVVHIIEQLIAREHLSTVEEQTL